MSRFLNQLTNLLPVWVVTGGILALYHPPLFTWFRGEAIVWGLTVIMLGMGVTLSLEDFNPDPMAGRDLRDRGCLGPVPGHGAGRAGETM